MPQVKIPQLNKIINVEHGANLFQALKDSHVPIASSCGGDAVCGKCTVQVKNPKNLHGENEAEVQVKVKLKIRKDVRISCQLSVHSDIEIETTYW